MRPFLLRKSHIYYWLMFSTFILSSYYSTTAQAVSKQKDIFISYTGTNVPLGQIFKAIKKQTGYSVMYSVVKTQIDLSEKKTVNFIKTPISDVLKELLKDKGLDWTFDDESIIIFLKAAKNVHHVDGTDSSITSISVSGKVTDTAGKPIPGATIIAKGTTVGTTTDEYGNFSFTNLKRKTTLLISSIGYEDREVPVTANNLLVRLGLSIGKLDETVIIAYGTTTKRLSTGNISSIKASDIAKQPVNNPILALQGRVPGVYIEQSTGVPGGNVKVRVQGTNSIRNGSSPLYVVDGVPFASSLLPSVSTILGPNGITDGPGSPLNFINPSDIESISVLKDADATAIYGSRAANGAVIITTKKGATGATKVTINMQAGWGRATRQIELLNTQDYLTLRKEAFANDGIDLTMPPYDQDIYKALVYPDLSIFDQKKYTNWQRQLIGNTAHYRDVQASVSGGSSTTQFHLSTGYHRETTVFPGNLSDTKGTVSLNLNHLSPNQKFHVQFSGSYMEDKNRLINMDLTSLALNLSPNAPSMYNADGSINWQPSSTGISTFIDNPARYLDQKFQNKSANLLSNLLVSYTIAQGLTLKSSFGYNKLQSIEHKISPLSSIPPEYTSRISSVDDANKYIESFIAEPQINYAHSIGIGTIGLMAGMTFQKSTSDLTAINGSGFDSDADLNNIAAAATVTITNRLASSYNYSAFFARLNYNWQNKYIININARRDGSSRFGVKNLFQNFFSVGAAWTFTEEHGIRELVPFIDFGKIRVTYGTTGNDQIGDYQFLSLYSPLLYQVPYQGIIGVAPTSHASPYIQWEETKKFNSGIDLTLLDNKIDLTVNYYRNRSANQLLPYSLPSVTGFTTVLRNISAIVQNSGFEMQINYHLFPKNGFSWETGLNATLPQNKLIAFPNLSTSTYANQLVIGQPMTITKLFEFSGVNPQTGLYEFTTAKGEKSSNPDPDVDKTVWANIEPTLFAGWTNSFSYKGFSLDFVLQFVKQKGKNLKFGNFIPGLNINQPSGILNRWQQPEDVSTIQKVNTDLSVFTQFDAANNSSAAFSDASFLRLKNVSLSYAFPEQITRRLKMLNAKMYIQGQNLLTITKFDGMDPENRSISSLPPLSIISVGIQCTF